MHVFTITHPPIITHPAFLFLLWVSTFTAKSGVVFTKYSKLSWNVCVLVPQATLSSMLPAKVSLVPLH